MKNKKPLFKERLFKLKLFISKKNDSWWCNCKNKENNSNNSLSENKTTGNKKNQGVSSNIFIDDSAKNDSTNSEIPFEPDKETDENIGLKPTTITIKTTYGKAGDTIPVIVDLKENPGILGAIFSLEYDENAMKLVDAEAGEAVSEVLTLTHSKELSSGAKFVLDGLELNSDDIKDGTLLVLYFELYLDATPGKRYPLNLTHKPGNVIDADLKPVNVVLSQGFIEIKE